MSSSGGADPWAWLGLLKWSLSYADGTSPSSAAPMSQEDKEFLEKVMAEGIVNENERMNQILEQVTSTMNSWKTEPSTTEQEEEVNELLQEVRDIVEQIDYARAFAAMKGLNFLLGCVQESQHVPRSTRLLCLGILSTLCQSNPPLQKEALELGSIKILSDLFFSETQGSLDANGQFRARIIQAISAIVRSHDIGEAVFCHLAQSVRLLEDGLGMHGTVPAVLRQRSLFFLRALLTSDSSTKERMQKFASCVTFVLKNLLDPATEDSMDIREMALAMVEQILEQKKSVNAVLDCKDFLSTLGGKRVAALRSVTGPERDSAAVELELWEKVLVLLTSASRDKEAAPQQLLTAA